MSIRRADDELSAEVDWTRRFDSMQQHTGQHILSAAFERVRVRRPSSSHSAKSAARIEVQLGETWPRVGEIEAAANRIVWEDRDREGIGSAKTSSALRTAQARPRSGRERGRIRIVEIPDWDVSACGGTHTRRTGEVGAIKVLRWEKVRGNLRFEFAVRRRSLEDHAWRTEALVEKRASGARSRIASCSPISRKPRRSATSCASVWTRCRSECFSARLVIAWETRRSP
jgi:alanyl-tRNA synthetase